MKLDQLEARLIEQLRQLPTQKITVVKHQGVIKSIRTEINAEVVDKALGRGEVWKSTDSKASRRVSRGTNDSQEEVTTRKGG